MHAQDLDAPVETGESGGKRSRQPLLGRLLAAEPGNEALARNAEQDGDAEFLKQAQTLKQFDIMAIVLAETDAGIDRDPRWRDAGIGAGRQALDEVGADVQRGIGVARILLHG